MLHTNNHIDCPHSKALPVECCTFCALSGPERLLDLCFTYISNNLECLCDTRLEVWRLHPNITLPAEICERLLHIYADKTTKLNTKFVEIFKDKQRTRLKRVRLRNTDLDDDGFRILLQHQLFDLEISHSPAITKNVIPLLYSNGDSLVNLTIGENMNIFPYSSFGIDQPYEPCSVLSGYNLRRLCLRSLKNISPNFFASLLRPLNKLTHLDLTNCNVPPHCLEHLTNLTSLVLHNVWQIDKAVPSICKLVNLYHLDISNSKEEKGRYQQASHMLATIVNSLPKLTSLDISGTNLAGTGIAENSFEFGRYQTDIPGLASRVSNPLNFLGLYETRHDACLRHDIPAKLIAGNANEEQILVGALAYLDRSEMLQKVLNDLFHLFRFESCKHIGQALYVILEGMNRHINEKHIQISGSATLFYIVKGTGEEFHYSVQVKRKIIMTLLNAMWTHRNDDTMMRNGCLTLCQFKIPDDVVFDYERLVTILLHSVNGMAQESFVQRIGIYLLNSLACQVDWHQKVKLGELGAINKMLSLITNRLERLLCDDVLEVAWSTMWNVTDETPTNCKKFLENAGMEYFLKCLEKFPDKEELLRNMMGLLGNVAEVKELRFHLMNSKYITVFSNLLESFSDGIEVSYNAAGVISHIASDGPEVWFIKEPSRESVLKKMVQAINRWDIKSHRNINYRSFQPILQLVRVYDTPECQHWAIWALANLTGVYPEKYCDLVISEGGIPLLEEIVKNPYFSFVAKDLALMVLDNCAEYRLQFEEHQLDG